MNYQHLKLRRQKGRKIYLTAEEFLSDAIEYFEWARDNPLEEEKLFAHQGEVTRAVVDKPRPFTKQALALYLGVPVSRFDCYKSRTGSDSEPWREVMEIIEQVIYTQKFENAVAGLMNAGIITRDLGLTDKQEIGGIKDAPPVAFNIVPIASGTFLPPEEPDEPAVMRASSSG
jgi:hypothetical protein